MLSQKKSLKVVYQKNFTQYVDPFIGTGFHGHVFLGANVPFGAVQLGPVNISEGWDWCSGYHYSDSTIAGFAHTRLSGTGIGDLGDIGIMPVIGDVRLSKGNPSGYSTGYYSLFSHNDEVARPGYYSVLLKRYNIKAEVTATERVGVHRYTFPKSADARILVDLKLGIGWDKPTETFIKRIDDRTVEGYRFSKGWADDQRIYFRAVFSKPFKKFQVSDSTMLKKGTELKASKVFGIAHFDTKAGEQVTVKVGISPVSLQGAAVNLSTEMSGWNFDKVVAEANAKWNRELSKVEIKTLSPHQLKVFYTSLYHTMIAPSLFNDVNKDYMGTDKKIYRNASFQNLTTFSLWDTYRAAHPLFTILQTEKVNDMINTMLAIYEQQGKLPVWHLMGCETNTMVGNPAIPVIADAWMKGFNGFDKTLAYEAMKSTTMMEERGLNFVKRYGFIPADSLLESVAIGLEYSIADAGIAQIARSLNRTADYEYFKERGMAYKHYFDPETKFMRGKLSKTSWRTPFDPFKSIHRQDDYTEGNAWQYTWLVPQHPEGLISLMGGDNLFVQKLDSLFAIEGHLGENASPDISGLIGQYAHGNEPAHHIAYLYAYAGQPWKTADRVRQVMSEMYTDKFDGLPGNEDVGQMSAWYIMSALGFYQVNPVGGMYVFGSPIINHAVLNIGDNKKFTIHIKNNSDSNKYIQRVRLNGKPYAKSYFMHSDMMKGGSLEIEMGNKPSATFGVSPSNRPFSNL